MQTTCSNSQFGQILYLVIPDICLHRHQHVCGEKICHVETFHMSWRDKCAEIWNFSTCGVITKFCCMKDVEKSFSSPHLACMWCGECLHMCKIHVFVVKLVLSLFTHFCRKSFLSQFTLYCVEKKFTKNSHVWRKNYNYQVCSIARVLIYLNLHTFVFISYHKAFRDLWLCNTKKS